MNNDKQCCATCAWHDDWTYVCFNPASEDGADFTDGSHVCNCWKGKPDEKQRY